MCVIDFTVTLLFSSFRITQTSVNTHDLVRFPDVRVNDVILYVLLSEQICWAI